MFICIRIFFKKKKKKRDIKGDGIRDKAASALVIVEIHEIIKVWQWLISENSKGP